MKNGYDQHFKKAQKIAFHGDHAQPVDRFQRSEPKKSQPRLQSKNTKALAEELRQRATQQKQPTKKSSKTISWKLVGYSLVGILIAAIGLWKIEQIEKIVKNIEISVLGTAYAEETKPADTKPAEATKEAAKEEPAKKEYTQEDINHFSKLNERKRELDAREEELGRMEQEIATQKAELDKRLAELESTRRNISSVLEEKVQADDKKVENLVQMYSNMKPQQAAKAFEEMDEGLAIEILGRMKKKNAAEIMNLVKSEKVKVFSEKYAGYKRN